MHKINFFYSIGSTYTYLTVSRLEKMARNSGASISWCPFNVRDIMIEQENIPFTNKPIKSAYMWRDIERRAGLYFLRPKLPAPYPLANLSLANQIATLGKQEGWAEAYTKATYRRWFEEGDPAGEDPNISNSLAEIGQDADRVMDLATSSEIIEALNKETTRAKNLGIFGSPSFEVNDEVFWGDDRLDDAISWAKKNR